MMDAFDSAFARALAKKIVSETAERIAQLATGRATTFEDYRHRVGYLLALNDVTAWAAEVERQLRQPEKS